MSHLYWAVLNLLGWRAPPAEWEAYDDPPEAIHYRRHRRLRKDTP